MPCSQRAPEQELTAEDGMLAACYYKHGKVEEVVRVSMIARPPTPGSGQLLVKVRAASLNPADWKSGKGEQAKLLSFQWPRVYGFDFSGEVAAVGEGAEEFKIGDEVFGMIRGLPQANRGTVAEYVLVEAEVCARRPPNSSHSACASVPLVSITVVNMFEACGLTEQPKSSPTGPRVFITGGSGGVGTIAIQLAKIMYGASFVATTASAGAKTDLCLSLGADKVVNYREEKYEDVLASDDDSQLFDAVLDCVGEAPRCVPLLKRGGTLASILCGPTQEALLKWMNEAKLDPANITTGVKPFLSSSFGASIYQVMSGARKLRKACEARGAKFAHVLGTGNGPVMAKIATKLASGELRAVVDKEFPLSKAVEAIQYQATGRAAGKVVIQIWEDKASETTDDAGKTGAASS